MPSSTLREPPSEDVLNFLSHNNDILMGTGPIENLSTLAQTAPHLQKNLEFLEENIEQKRLELELINELHKV
jgi:hypothetical protein